MVSNLPPGCSVGDLLGNRPEDEFYEKQVEAFLSSVFDAYEAMYILVQDVNHPVLVHLEDAIVEDDGSKEARRWTREDLLDGPIRRVEVKFATDYVGDEGLAHLAAPEHNPPVEDADARIEELVEKALEDARVQFGERSK